MKQKQTYTITFSDGVFGTETDHTQVNINGTATTLTPSIAAAPGTETTGISSIGASGAALTVAFNGTTMAESSANYLLGTCTYTYTAWNTVDPGTYNTVVVATIQAP